MNLSRRRFLHHSTATLAASTSGISLLASAQDVIKTESEPRFKISLAQWSLHRALQDETLDNLDFPKFVREKFDIHAIEWVNHFFGEPHPTLGFQPKDHDYLDQMKRRMDDLGMRSVLIMCGKLGQLGNPDDEKRRSSVEGHYAWLEAAKFLGCHSIRVDSRSDASLSPEQQAELCTDGIRCVTEKAREFGLNVILENHGGLSSDGAWLAGIVKKVGLDNCGTLPDLNNFYILQKNKNAARWEKEKSSYTGNSNYQEDEHGIYYDPYRGVKELMPYAKGVSAKTRDFDEQGNEAHIDYRRMMSIVKDAGYHGYVGIEYSGEKLDEVEGVLRSKTLLERVFSELG